MKQAVLFIVFLVIMLLVSGCQGNKAGSESPGKEGNPVEVTITDGDEFPEFLVGRWKAEGKSGWQITFDRDGSISSTVISLGRVEIKPGQITQVPMKQGGKGIFEPGQWMVHYCPTDRNLTVEITLKHFNVQIGNGVLEGNSTDLFTGKVSEDGKIWQTVWTSFPDYVAHTAKYPNFDLSADLNSSVQKALIFKKVSPEVLED